MVLAHFLELSQRYSSYFSSLPCAVIDKFYSTGSEFVGEMLDINRRIITEEHGPFDSIA